MDLMKIWKSQIRNSLMTVRSQFIDWVDSFTQQFVRQLKGIESQQELAELGGSMIDSALRKMLDEMRESYVQILLIFQDISNKSSQGKLDTIKQSK
jgi:chemotaxis regulatin CheY-phosphate phosphatase CheZ